MHATEVFLNNDVATLAWDAVTLEQHHINCIYVQTPEKRLTLSIAPLAGAVTEDYVCHITDVLDQMTTVYSAYHDKDPVRIKDLLVKKVTST